MKAGGWDRHLPGQLQVDLVEHCGQSASGLYGNTVSCADVAFGWWEGEIVLGSGQERSCNALERIRKRTPFNWLQERDVVRTALQNFEEIAEIPTYSVPA